MDTPDAVHKRRVTARRIRSVLQGYRRVLDREATRELVEDLRWLGTELAPARDGEVFAARITDAIHALPAEQALGPVTAQVTRRFAREQADGRDRLTLALYSQRYLRLQERLDTLLDDPPSTRRAQRRAKSPTGRPGVAALSPNGFTPGPGVGLWGWCHRGCSGAQQPGYVLVHREVGQGGELGHRQHVTVPQPAAGDRGGRVAKVVAAVAVVAGERGERRRHGVCAAFHHRPGPICLRIQRVVLENTL